MSELIGLKWEEVGADSLTLDERCCRGDWDAPKSEASIGSDPCVIDRIKSPHAADRDVKAGLAVRRYKVVKSDRPEDLWRVHSAARSTGSLSRSSTACRSALTECSETSSPYANRWKSDKEMN